MFLQWVRTLARETVAALTMMRVMRWHEREDCTLAYGMNVEYNRIERWERTLRRAKNAPYMRDFESRIDREYARHFHEQLLRKIKTLAGHEIDLDLYDCGRWAERYARTLQTERLALEAEEFIFQYEMIDLGMSVIDLHRRHHFDGARATP